MVDRLHRPCQSCAAPPRCYAPNFYRNVFHCAIRRKSTATVSLTPLQLKRARREQSWIPFEWFIIQFNWVMRADWLWRWVFQTNTLTLLPNSNIQLVSITLIPPEAFNLKFKKHFVTAAAFPPTLVGLDGLFNLPENSLQRSENGSTIKLKDHFKASQIQSFLKHTFASRFARMSKIFYEKSCYATFNIRLLKLLLAVVTGSLKLFHKFHYSF